MGELRVLISDLGRLLEQSEPLQHAVGQEAKRLAHDTASRALGADRAFSGLRRKVALSAGYDTGSPVVLNLRPKGLWMLADKGRTRTKVILPRRGRPAKNPNRRKAVQTPQGWRASSLSRPSRGHRVLEQLEQRLERELPDAAERGISIVIRKAGF